MYNFFRVFFVVLHFFFWLRFIDPKFLFWAACKNKNQNLFLRSHLLLFFIFVVQGFKWWAMRNLFFSNFFFFCLVCGFWDFVKKTNASYFMHTSVKFTFFAFCWSGGEKRCITLNTDIYLKFVVVIFFCMFHKYRQKSSNKKEKHTILCIFQGFSKHEISS